eukprot:PhM_4_TR7954/c0_g1_i1/m.2957
MQRRTQRLLWCPWFAGNGEYRLPGTPIVNKEEVRNWKWDNKAREPFGYNRVDDHVNDTSEFRKPRDSFTNGPRECNEMANDWSYGNPKKYKRLHEYFDEYSKPGTNPKVEAVRAVKEYWDASEFYYQGETWKRNRPSFRSVPQEILNKQTWYHYTQWVTTYNKYATTARPRATNPLWPPPGYKLPEFVTEKKFLWGCEDPGLVAEIERWMWHRMWFENVSRVGPWEIGPFLFGLYWGYYNMRSMQDYLNMLKVFSGLYFPGQHMVRAFGEPKDPIKEGWWWQKPLEEWPNQGDIWYLKNCRFGYIDYVKKRDEERAKAKAEAEAEAAAATA